MALHELLIELVVLGIFLGAFYGLAALGLSLVFGVQNVINLAHGEFLMIGAYLTFFGWSLFDLHPLISIILVVPVTFVIGVAIQWGLLERIDLSNELTTLIFTFGLALTIRGLATYSINTSYQAVSFLSESVTVGPASFSLNRPFAFVLSVVSAALFFAFLKYTDWGKAIRATSQNADIARACGIRTKRVRMVTFGLGASLAGIAGGIAGILYTIFPAMGLEYLLRAFVVVVVGGLGSLIGALVAGIGFGIVESFGTFYATPTIASLLAFVVLILTLLVRPQGLFGRVDTED
ncbi:branched-chain amino acid ABC transporter permease [Haloplanus rallus]|jgi:branched-chain amino acid transport system permease protein|uniref:Branched-chain amino acid ABC transporter permease n=1 Tax=Haloplanus rallus TaxID=1816183 RepID=A0A6B9F738_9EURY|nr:MULTISPECIES: branched-chain amino acid ABC transporter permease [Haloplanus]QGX94237.1 branched-chain amino acid ABC transporter permease [Haloplanus rallus]